MICTINAQWHTFVRHLSDKKSAMIPSQPVPFSILSMIPPAINKRAEKKSHKGNANFDFILIAVLSRLTESIKEEAERIMVYYDKEMAQIDWNEGADLINGFIDQLESDLEASTNEESALRATVTELYDAMVFYRKRLYMIATAAEVDETSEDYKNFIADMAEEASKGKRLSMKELEAYLQTP